MEIQFSLLAWWGEELAWQECQDAGEGKCRGRESGAAGNG